jgi:hypothetical protein
MSTTDRTRASGGSLDAHAKSSLAIFCSLNTSRAPSPLRGSGPRVAQSSMARARSMSEADLWRRGRDAETSPENKGSGAMQLTPATRYERTPLAPAYPAHA